MKPRLSTSSVTSEGSVDKSIRGYQHIVQELSAENAVLSAKVKDLEAEMSLLKEVCRGLHLKIRASGFAGLAGVV